MSADEVEVEGMRLPVRHTSKQGLRTLTFTMGDPITQRVSGTTISQAVSASLPAAGIRSSSSKMSSRTDSWRLRRRGRRRRMGAEGASLPSSGDDGLWIWCRWKWVMRLRPNPLREYSA